MDPVRPDGYTDQMWNDHLAGWRRAEADIASIMTPMHPGPVAETRTLTVTDQLVAAADLLHESARTSPRRLAEGVHVAVTDLPGQPPSAQERRQRALEQALASGTQVIWPGDAAPKQDFVLPGPDGAAEVRRQPMPVMVPFGPDNAAEVDRQFGSRHREWENRVLVRKFGEKACRQAGIIP